jgi:DUF4097 and DUF4098 domain-containing protein YvlB
MTVKGLTLAGACVLAAAGHSCSHTYFVESRFVVDLSEAATRVDSANLTFETGDALAVELPAGPVTVKALKGGNPSYTARITTRGKTKEDAERNLASVKIQAGRDGRGISIRTEGDMGWRQRGTVSAYSSVELDVTVPQGTSLDIRTGSGDVRASGPFGGTSIETSYGSVELRDAEGSVHVKSKSGSVGVEHVKGAELVRVASGFGAVKLSSCEGARVEAESSSGDVAAVNVIAKETILETKYGRVEARRITGALDVKSSSGDVTVEDAVGGAVRAESGFGAIHLRRIAGSVRAKTSSGDVEVSECQGAVDAASSYGGVKVTGLLTTVQAQSKSGNVLVDAGPASAVSGAWSVSSGFGSVTVVLPSTASGPLDAKTSYGSVETDFPVLLAAGVKSKGNSLRGTLNPPADPAVKGSGGGFSLTASSSSGDVKIRKS